MKGDYDSDIDFFVNGKTRKGIKRHEIRNIDRFCYDETEYEHDDVDFTGKIVGMYGHLAVKALKKIKTIEKRIEHCYNGIEDILEYIGKLLERYNSESTSESKKFEILTWISERDDAFCIYGYYLQSKNRTKHVYHK